MNVKALLAGVALFGCAAPEGQSATYAGQHHGPGHPHAANAPASDLEKKLAEVALIHGGAGPWAVAGYRMGEHAMVALGVTRGSFDLEVVHHSPREVQYSCIADGAAAATGASLGKLNLALSESPAPETRTVYRNKQSGATITLRPAAAFTKRFSDIARSGLEKAGREAMALPDAEVFEVVEPR